MKRPGTTEQVSCPSLHTWELSPASVLTAGPDPPTYSPLQTLLPLNDLASSPSLPLFPIELLYIVFDLKGRVPYKKEAQ